MTRYREVAVVDALDYLDDLLTLIVVGREHLADKDVADSVILKFVLPHIEKIKRMLEDDDRPSFEEDEDETENKDKE